MWVIDERGKIYRGKETIETDLGKVELKGGVGDVIKSHKNRRFVVIGPEIPDFLKKAKRGPQTMEAKDIGFIITKTGLREGYRVLDAGAGSGFFTIYASKIVGKNGKVYSYERDSRSLKILKNNLEEIGAKNVEIIEKDVYKGIKQKELDLINLDLAEPWRVLRHAKKSLKKGGFMSVYLPNITQVQEFIKKNKFFVDSINEILKREWVVDKNICRPKHHMLGHTAFIIILRNI